MNFFTRAITTCLLFTLCVTCSISTAAPFAKNFVAKVIAIKDGDTYKVLYHGHERTIRLAHIDCPEKKQPFSTQAKQMASTLCFGKIVTVKTDGKTDRYKRLIGEIILADGTNVNKELVKKGLAWHYKKYSTNTEYVHLEKNARELRLGLWADTKPIAPWDWRQKKASLDWRPV